MLWNFWEGRLMETLVMGMNNSMETKDNIEKKKNALIEYLTSHLKVRMQLSRTHNSDQMSFHFDRADKIFWVSFSCKTESYFKSGVYIVTLCNRR